MAADASLDDLYSHQADIASSALAAGGLPEWMAARNNQLDRLHHTLEEMAQAEHPNSAMITVANGLYPGPRRCLGSGRQRLSDGIADGDGAGVPTHIFGAGTAFRQHDFNSLFNGAGGVLMAKMV